VKKSGEKNEEEQYRSQRPEKEPTSAEENVGD
jgi:hypothetical protein